MRLRKNCCWPGGPPVNDDTATTTNRDLAFKRMGDLTARATFVEPLRRRGLTSLDALFACDDIEPLTKPGLDAWRERFRLVLSGPDGGTRTLYMKRFNRPPRRAERIRRRTCPGARSAAGVEWYWMRELARDGIPCPRPVALGERVEGRREIRSAVIAEGVPGESLERWAQQRVKAASDSSDRRELHRLIGGVADLIRAFHRAGYIHRDLYLSHIFYDPKGASARWLWLIDLQRVMRPRWCRRRWIDKDLAALNYSTPAGVASTSDRLRWFKRYCGLAKLDAIAKGAIRRVAAKTRRIARHDRRRKARLGGRCAP